MICGTARATQEFAIFFPGPSIRVVPRRLVVGFFRESGKFLVFNGVGDRFVDVRQEDDHRADGWVLKFYDLTPFQEVALFLCEFHAFIFPFDHSSGNRAVP